MRITYWIAAFFIGLAMMGVTKFAHAQHAYSALHFVETDFEEFVDKMFPDLPDGIEQIQPGQLPAMSIVFDKQPGYEDDRTYGVAWAIDEEPNGDLTCNIYMSTVRGQTKAKAEEAHNPLQQSWYEKLYAHCQFNAGVYLQSLMVPEPEAI